MALRTAIHKREVTLPETQAFSPPNLSDAAEMRAARSWMRSRRKMLDARNTSITFLPLSDGEQLTLRNRLDSRLKHAPKPALENTTKPEVSTAQNKTAIDKIIGRSKIERIFKLWQVKENDKSKEIREQTKLRPGRKLAPGGYEITFSINEHAQELSPTIQFFRLLIPKECPAKAKVTLVIARDDSQFQTSSLDSSKVLTKGLAGKSHEKAIIVTVLAKKQANQSNYITEIVKLTTDLTNATTDPLGWSWTDDSQDSSIGNPTLV
jgi:hypothetical protein